MDVDDAFRLPMGQEHFLKQPQDNGFWSSVRVLVLLLDGASPQDTCGSKDVCRIWLKCHVL